MSYQKLRDALKVLNPNLKIIKIVSANNDRDFIEITPEQLIKFESTQNETSFIIDMLFDIPSVAREIEIPVNLANLQDLAYLYKHGIWPSQTSIYVISDRKGKLPMVSHYLNIRHVQEPSFGNPQKKKETKRQYERYEEEEEDEEGREEERREQEEEDKYFSNGEYYDEIEEYDESEEEPDFDFFKSSFLDNN
jgi:hypothetical protein